MENFAASDRRGCNEFRETWQLGEECPRDGRRLVQVERARSRHQRNGTAVLHKQGSCSFARFMPGMVRIALATLQAISEAFRRFFDERRGWARYWGALDRLPAGTGRGRCLGTPFLQESSHFTITSQSTLGEVVSNLDLHRTRRYCDQKRSAPFWTSSRCQRL
jgi:hypothetical protein